MWSWAVVQGPLGLHHLSAAWQTKSRPSLPTSGFRGLPMSAEPAGIQQAGWSSQDPGCQLQSRVTHVDGGVGTSSGANLNHRDRSTHPRKMRAERLDVNTQYL